MSAGGTRISFDENQVRGFYFQVPVSFLCLVLLLSIFGAKPHSSDSGSKISILKTDLLGFR